MLGTDPAQPIPSAAELLRHPWFPVDGIEDEDAVAPMPLLPGQKVGYLRDLREIVANSAVGRVNIGERLLMGSICACKTFRPCHLLLV